MGSDPSQRLPQRMDILRNFGMDDVLRPVKLKFKSRCVQSRFQAAIHRAGSAGKVRNIRAKAPLSTSAVACAISGAK